MTARDRLIQAAAATAAVSLLLWGTAAYGLYFRTATYRHRVEAELTDFFQLPTEVGRVEPHTLRSRVFRDVRIWLPGRRDRVFDCPTAIWRQAGRGKMPDLYLELNGGMLTIGSEQWLPEDYRRVLRAAFTKNLADVNLREVQFHGVDLAWPRGRTRLTAENVTGRIVFDEHHRGEATLVARSLNGFAVGEPIHIRANVRPTEDEFLPEVRLTVPTLPIAVLQLDGVLNAPVRSGRFSGTIAYRQEGTAETVRIAGQADGLELGELTSRAPFGPVEGRLSLRIDEASVAGSPPSLVSVRLGGRLDGLDLGPLARRAGYPEIHGRAGIVVHQAQFEGRHIRELSAGGWVDGVGLREITRRLGIGVIHGDLSVRVNALRILENEIALLDADVDIRPPKDAAGTIDRRVLLETFKRLVGLRLPEQILPEQVEYSRMGATVRANRGRLRLLGRVGPGGAAMIVLRLLQQEIPVPPPSETFSIQTTLDQIQARARDVNLDTLKRWWRTPASVPATGPTTSSRPR